MSEKEYALWLYTYQVALSSVSGPKSETDVGAAAATATAAVAAFREADKTK